MSKVFCEIPRWQYIKSKLNNYNYKDFVHKMNKDKNSVLIDVRTPEELDQTVFDVVVNINYLSHDLADQLEALDKTKNYYVFCRTGRRSIRVCTLLNNSGFEFVHNLDGGLTVFTDI